MSLATTVFVWTLMGVGGAFCGWVGYTCGYDRGWADKEDGKQHRDLRRTP